MENTTTIEPMQAFNNAIACGFLSENEKATNFAGNYMYMYTTKEGNHFKHSITRQYIIHKSN